MKDASTSATRRLLAAMAPQAGVAVAFHLPTVRKVADDEQVRGMYFLGDEIDLDEIEAVAMAPGGPARLLRDGTVLLPPVCPRSTPFGPSLLESHAPELEHLEPLGQLCIGIGRIPGLPPVALALDFEDGFARGAAVLRSKPQGAGLDLLPAIGVQLLGTSILPDGRVRLDIENRLEAHLDAARLSLFKRTNNCNRFFLSHGDADGDIANGLLQAARVRIAEGRRRTSAAVIALARRAIDEGLSLHMRAPGRSGTSPYGDLVPLGFLGAALERIAASDDESASKAAPLLEDLRSHLESHRRSWGWGYSRGCIPTGTDTALVALAGVEPDFDAMEALRGPTGGFIPQLVGDDRGPDIMRRSEATAHWELEDIPTTALLETLRLDAELESGVDATWFLKRIPKWSGGLYFTPSLLGFWSIARLLTRLERNQPPTVDTGENAEEPESTARLAQLRGVLEHVVAGRLSPSKCRDRFNPVLNESLLVLTLDELGKSDRTSLTAQLRLLDSWEHPRGVETPFHSTLVTPPPRSFEEIMAIQADPHRAFVHDQVHAASTYEDPDRLIVSALACMALHVETTADQEEHRPRSIDFETGSTPQEQALLSIRPYATPARSIGEDQSDPFVAPRDLISLDAAMRHTLDLLGPKLVSEPARDRVLAAVARTNPEHLKGSTFGLELRLHEDDDTIDFLWCLARSKRNLTALLSDPDRHTRFQHLARLWNVPGGGSPPPIAFIDQIWFEHDLDDDTTLPPAFFFGPSFLFKRDSSDPVENGSFNYGNKEVAENIRRVVSSLDLDEQVSRDLLAGARRVEMLDTDCGVFQTGLMFSRSTNPIRLCFRPVSDTEAIFELLNRLGLGERVADVASVLPLKENGRVAVCVDVSSKGASPRIGLECYEGTGKNLMPHAIRMLDILVEKGHVSEERAMRFGSIPGWTQLGQHGGVDRRINHIKMVVQPERPLEIKGYVALSRASSPNPSLYRITRTEG